MGKVKIAIYGLIAIQNQHSMLGKIRILNILNFRYYAIFLRSFQCPQLCFGLCGKWALELVGREKKKKEKKTDL